MRRIIIGLVAVGLFTFGAGEWKSSVAGEAAKPTDDKAMADSLPSTAREAAPSPDAAPPVAAGDAAPAGEKITAGVPAGGTMSPIDRVASTPKGQLKNPYTDYAGMADEGHKKFMSEGCNGCHGGGGGGGMCPPLTNDTWVYGRDDDTLFRLITLGSDDLQKQGYKRVKHETVTGPMPPFGKIIKTDNDLWKIIAWIRAVNPNSLIPPKIYAPPPDS